MELVRYKFNKNNGSLPDFWYKNREYSVSNVFARNDSKALYKYENFKYYLFRELYYNQEYSKDKHYDDSNENLPEEILNWLRPELYSQKIVYNEEKGKFEYASEIIEYINDKYNEELLIQRLQEIADEENELINDPNRESVSEFIGRSLLESSKELIEFMKFISERGNPTYIVDYTDYITKMKLPSKDDDEVVYHNQFDNPKWFAIYDESEDDSDYIIRTIETYNTAEKPTRIVFSGNEGLYEILNIECSELTSTEDMFRDCINLVSVNGLLISYKVNYMQHMFDGCRSLINVNGISDWNTSSVLDTSYLFKDCTSLGLKKPLDEMMEVECTTLDLSKWIVNKVKFADGMFKNCFYLTKLNLGNWWNGENNQIQSIRWMFSESGIKEINISNWKLPNLLFVNGLFKNCINLEKIIIKDVIKNDKTIISNLVKNAKENSDKYINYYENYLETYFDKELNGTPDKFDYKNYNRFDYVIDASEMFMNCPNLKSVDIILTDRIYTVMSMFSGCTSLEEIDTRDWNTSSIENMKYLFYNCILLKSLTGEVKEGIIPSNNISSWNVKNVKTMSKMFFYCYSLLRINIGWKNVRSDLDISWMFENCYDLENIQGAEWVTSEI